jgi:hypothetical protein
MSVLGQPLDRTDGLLKVTGQARYSADNPEAKLAYAVLVTSTIAHGRVASIDIARIPAMPVRRRSDRSGNRNRLQAECRSHSMNNSWPAVR